MPHLEPTYLRYIYDGLVKGSIHPENAAELPDGLIGMYEEAFDERTSVIERQKLLRRFAIWALLKKEVSAAFVAEVLGETEDDIQEFISTYSAWFNSPESGKYQLYHERLKVYLLQKMSEGEIHALHEKLIGRLEKAIEAQKADEFEWYAREFLTSHLAVAAMLNGDGKKLIDLAYSQTHWQRQLKISKGYTWTKNGLKEVMSWASKYNDDEVIECGLQMVDLHHQEQNGAPQIGALVAEGDFDAALKRIEQFGGSDKEGLQRKFILYMLCLMELTLLESKDKPNRKVGIEKLLKHLDEQLPVDHSVLNWNDFFPSYMLFLMASEWIELGLDYLLVYKRTDDWEKAWLAEKGLYTDIQFEVLLECTRGIRIDSYKSSALMDISEELAKQGKIEEALECARGISYDRYKSSALKDISEELAKQEKTEEAASVMQEALECARGISYDRAKSRALKEISAELAKQGKILEAASVMQEALECARGISDDRDKSSALNEISAELAKQGKILEAASMIHEALECARGIRIDSYKNSALKDISAELAKQGKIEEALECARGISYDISFRNEALMDISEELAKQEKTEEAASLMQEALECARGISNNIRKSSALNDISAELAKQGKILEATSVIQEALECARGISNNIRKSRTLNHISAELVKQGKIVEALECTRGISDDRDKSSALKDISAELVKQGKIVEAASVMHEALECARGISDDISFRNKALMDISEELAKQGKIEEALKCARGISDDRDKSSALKDISAELAKLEKTEEAASMMQEAIECARGISDDRDKSSALKEISAELAKQEKTEEAASMMQEALECARGISNSILKSRALKEISAELAKQGKIEEALKCARGISYDFDKSSALNDISAELAKQEKTEEAASMMLEALECARGIINDYQKSNALKDISAELAKQGYLPLAEQIGLEIPLIADRQNCWEEMANSIIRMHGWHAAFEKAQKLQTEGASIYYLKGIFNLLTSNECNEEFILSARKFYLKDMVSMKKLFQNYAIYELFIQENSGDKIERLNRTLDIQWAIDIKNQLPN